MVHLCAIGLTSIVGVLTAESVPACVPMNFRRALVSRSRRSLWRRHFVILVRLLPLWDTS